MSEEQKKSNIILVRKFHDITIHNELERCTQLKYDAFKTCIILHKMIYGESD